VLKVLDRKIPKLPRELKCSRVLEYFEGDILTELRADNDSAFYLEKWCDSFQNMNRFLIVRANQRSIAEYLAGKIHMQKLLKDSSDGSGFIVDKINGIIQDVYTAFLEELPPSYFPTHLAFHDEDLRPNWEKVPQDFLLDSNWDAKLLALIERVYLDVSGFSFFTEPGKGRKIPPVVLSYLFNGGYPIMHSYNAIRKAIPSQYRAKSVGVSANSPGILTIESPNEIATHLAKSIYALDSCKATYQAVHEWSRLKPANVEQVPTTALNDLIAFGGNLGVDIDAMFPVQVDSEPDPKSKRENILAVGKLITAHYRKLWRIVNLESRVEFISVKVESVGSAPTSLIYEEDDDEGFEL